jgi:SAM-dependent methyltransferase
MLEKIDNCSGLTMSVKEFFSLLGLNFLVLIRNAIEFFKVAFRYYGSFSFLKTDLALRLMYLFNNPFKISKRFLQNKGKIEIYAYGETPLTSLEFIAKECNLNSKDCVFELGCGRGRTCFWLHSFIGCSVVGIEYVPEFIERANAIKRMFKISEMEFRLADMAKADFNGGTVYYLYGSCLEDKIIKALASKLARMPSGTKIITVSYSLVEYSEKKEFEVMKRFTVPYTWGEADVYLQVVI